MASELNPLAAIFVPVDRPAAAAAFVPMAGHESLSAEDKTRHRRQDIFIAKRLVRDAIDVFCCKSRLASEASIQLTCPASASMLESTMICDLLWSGSDGDPEYFCYFESDRGAAFRTLTPYADIEDFKAIAKESFRHYKRMYATHERAVKAQLLYAADDKGLMSRLTALNHTPRLEALHSKANAERKTLKQIMDLEVHYARIAWEMEVLTEAFDRARLAQALSEELLVSHKECVWVSGILR
jgi:hypothetical protein